MIWIEAAVLERLRTMAQARLVPAEPTRRLDALQFGKVKIANSPQGPRRGALGQIIGQAVAPCPVFVLQLHEFGYGVAPTLRAAASVGGPLRSTTRPTRGAKPGPAAG